MVIVSFGGLYVQDQGGEKILVKKRRVSFSSKRAVKRNRTGRVQTRTLWARGAG